MASEERQEPSGPRVQRSFQVLKTSAFPLGPQQRLLILPTGGAAPSASPSYHTSSLTWCRGIYLPPSFSIYDGAHYHAKGSRPPNAESSAPVEKKPPVARVAYKNFEGLVGLRFDLAVTAGGGDAPARTVKVRRQGCGRTYPMQTQAAEAMSMSSSLSSSLSSAAAAAAAAASGDTLIWQGISRRAVQALQIADSDHAGGLREAPRVRGGHLKLVRARQPEVVLAVWENDTAVFHLGNVVLLEEFEEGDEGLLLEVLAGCVGVVAAERMSLRGWCLG